MELKKLTKDIGKVSKIYSKKFKIDRNADWYLLKLQEEVGELTRSYLKCLGQARTSGKTSQELKNSFNEELADVFCHVLLLAQFHDIDLEKEVQNKWLVYK